MVSCSSENNRWGHALLRWPWHWAGTLRKNRLECWSSTSTLILNLILSKIYLQWHIVILIKNSIAWAESTFLYFTYLCLVHYHFPYLNRTLLFEKWKMKLQGCRLPQVLLAYIINLITSPTNALVLKISFPAQAWEILWYFPFWKSWEILIFMQVLDCLQ